MANFNGLIKAGLTNVGTEDLGVISTSKNKLIYDYYCHSFKCAGQNDYGKLKITTSEWLSKCKDCGHHLYSKRAKKEE